MTITEFLEARIAEDEAIARDRPASAPIHYTGCYYYSYSLDSGWFCDCDEDGKASARLLAECAAKRAIIKAFDPQSPDLDPYVGRDVIAMLAAAYKDHPDYQQEWA
jgi:hypothetical protein